MPRSLQKQVRPPPTQQESASKVQKTADRQTTGGKSIKVPGGPGSADVLSAIPLRTATGPSEGRSGRQGNFDLTLLDLPMRVKSYSQSRSQPGDSPISRQSIGRAYTSFSPSVSGADNSPRWPDGAQYARAMLKAVPRDEKEAIPGINSFNADRVLVDLADVCSNNHAVIFLTCIFKYAVLTGCIFAGYAARRGAQTSLYPQV